MRRWRVNKETNGASTKLASSTERSAVAREPLLVPSKKKAFGEECSRRRRTRSYGFGLKVLLMCAVVWRVPNMFVVCEKEEKEKEKNRCFFPPQKRVSVLPWAAFRRLLLFLFGGTCPTHFQVTRRTYTSALMSGVLACFWQQGLSSTTGHPPTNLCLLSVPRTTSSITQQQINWDPSHISA